MNPYDATEEEWDTIRELLLAGCSMPDRLRRIYEAHQREVAQDIIASIKARAALGEEP